MSDGKKYLTAEDLVQAREDHNGLLSGAMESIVAADDSVKCVISVTYATGLQTGGGANILACGVLSELGVAVAADRIMRSVAGIMNTVANDGEDTKESLEHTHIKLLAALLAQAIGGDKELTQEAMKRLMLGVLIKAVDDGDIETEPAPTPAPNGVTLH